MLWPTTIGKQEIEPLLGKDAAQQLSPNDDRIVLMPAPFQTAGDEVRSGSTYLINDVSNAAELDYEKAIIIADFGIGSDSPIVLYCHSAIEASIMYLRWRSDEVGSRKEWVNTHASFNEFANAINLHQALSGFNSIN